MEKLIDNHARNGSFCFDTDLLYKKGNICPRSSLHEIFPKAITMLLIMCELSKREFDFSSGRLYIYKTLGPLVAWASDKDGLRPSFCPFW
jgi:hypothetical protein